MAKYKVIKYFTDLQDNEHAYKTGDTFPREGLEVSEKRLEELASANNKRGVALIELVEDFPMPKPIIEPEPEKVVAEEKPEPAKRGRKGKKE